MGRSHSLSFQCVSSLETIAYAGLYCSYFCSHSKKPQPCEQNIVAFVKFTTYFILLKSLIQNSVYPQCQPKKKKNDTTE